MTQAQPISHAVEEYLEALHRLISLGEEPCTTRLAGLLKVTPASVTGMLRRLRDLGLITYHRYGQIGLTTAGEQQAWEVVRRHRLAERLLTDVLGVPLEQAHAEACRLEHALSAEVERRLAAYLGEPVSCPHGHPLQSCDDTTWSLLEAPLHRKLVVARLQDESPEVIRYLSDRGLLPQAALIVTKCDKLAKTITVQMKQENITLGNELAALIRVLPFARKQH